VYISPADPTLQLVDPLYAPASYGLNMVALETRPNFTSGFPDGLASTIAGTERYHRSFMNHLDDKNSNVRQVTLCRYNTVEPGFKDASLLSPERGATFADRGFHGEVLPVTQIGDAGPVTRPSVPGQTFQVQPKPDSA
jgi:hypothetical protein